MENKDKTQIREFSIDYTELDKFKALEFEEGKKVRIKGWVGPFDIQNVKEKTSKKGNVYYTIQFLVGGIDNPEREYQVLMRLWENEKHFFDKFGAGEFLVGDYIDIEGEWKGPNFFTEENHIDATALFHDHSTKKKPKDDNSSPEGRFEIGFKTKISPDSVVNLQRTPENMAEMGYSGTIVSDTNSMRSINLAREAFQRYNHMKTSVGLEMSVYNQPKFVHYPNDLNLDDLDCFVAWDTETTGIGNLFNDIIQLSAVKFKKSIRQVEIKKRGKKTGEFYDEVVWDNIGELDIIVHTDKKLEDLIINLTGITQDMVDASTITPRQAIDQFVEFSKDAQIYVGQNIEFDLNMLYGVDKFVLDKPVMDTLTMARHVHPNKRSYNLTALCKLFKIKLDNAHNALYDSLATGLVFASLLPDFRNHYPDFDGKLSNIPELEKNNDHAHVEIPFTKNIQIVAKTYEAIKDLFTISSVGHIQHYYKHAKLPLEKFKVLTHNRDKVLVGNGGIDSLMLEIMLTEGIERALAHALDIKYDFISIPHPEALGYYVNENEKEKELIEEEKGLLLESLSKVQTTWDAIVLENDFLKLLNSTLHFDLFDTDLQECESTPMTEGLFNQINSNIQDYISKSIEHMKNERIKARKDYKVLFDSFKMISEKLNVPLVVTSDIRKDKEEWLGAKVFAGIPEWKNVRLFHPDELIEMMSHFTDEPRKYVIDNTLIIRDLINEDAVYKVMPLHPPIIENSDKILREKTYKGAHKYYGENLPQILVDRIEKELNSIIGEGFQTVYLTVADMIEYINGEGYIVGSRGSVGSSIVAYLTGITDVNAMQAHYRSKNGDYVEFTDYPYSGVDMPDKYHPDRPDEKLIKDGHNLTYEIFAGLGGDKVPDIDLNFDGVSQVMAWNWVRERFGHDKVFRVGTTSTNTYEGASKKLGAFLAKNPQYDGLFDRSQVALEGAWHYNTNGKHAGGVYIVPSNKDVFDFTPIQYPARNDDSGWMTTSLDKDTLHDSLLKLDILGHEDEKMLRVMYKRAGMTLQDVKDIPLDDPAVLQFFDGYHNIGLPEIGTDYISGIIKITQPKNFSSLVQVEGLAHSKTAWGEARGRLESGRVNIMEVIGTRDKIFNDLVKGGTDPKLSLQIVEFIKKKTPLTMEMFHAIRTCKGLPDWYETSLLNQTYLYPGAHAVAYAMSAFRIAWFKAHKPLLFYRTWLELKSGLDRDMVVDMIKNDPKAMVEKYNDIERRMISECLTRIQSVSPNYELFRDVDFNISKSHEYVDHDNHIYLPFSILEGVSDSNAVYLEELRNEHGQLTPEIIIASPKRKLPTKAQNAILAQMEGNGIE